METRARKRTKSEKEEEGKRCIKTTLDNDKETHGCRRREDRQSTKERRRSEKVEAKSGGKREEGRRGAGGKLAMKVRERERDFENEKKRSRGGGRALLFDSSRAAAENTNGRIMKMTLCDAAATLARRDSFEQ